MTYENEIFKTIQTSMVNVVKEASLDTIDQTADHLKGLIEYAKVLNEKTPRDAAVKETPTTKPEPEPKPKDKPKVKRAKYPENTGILRRKLVGATVENDNGDSIYMSEQIVRENSFKEGDCIQYEEMKNSKSSMKTYWFTLEEANAEDIVSNRKEFKKGRLQADEKGRLYVRKSINDKPLIVEGEESPYVLTISEKERYDVQAGDYIDLAWYDTAPHSTMRVIWVYRGD